LRTAATGFVGYTLNIQLILALVHDRPSHRYEATGPKDLINNPAFVIRMNSRADDYFRKGMGSGGPVT
jgi:hypothetical protein